MRFRSASLLLLTLAVVASVLYLRRWPRPARTPIDPEAAVVPSPPPTAAPPVRPSAPPPAAGEVGDTIDRVFARSVSLDESTSPAFVAGDFNGDGIADLAVAVRPRKLEADGRFDSSDTACGRQDAEAPAGGTTPAKVAAGEVLLAVVHGEGDQAWRAPDLGQCFLVHNAVGRGLQRRPLEEAPSSVRLRVIRVHTGDVVATARAGRPGMVFWTGAAYAWAALKE